MSCLTLDDHRCALCGTVSQQPVIFSDSAMGAPDLDGRPAEPARYTLFALIQRCRTCGFCAPDIRVENPTARALRDDRSYRAELWDDGRPALANHFLCWSLVATADGRFDQAAWAAIRAAWACDDDDSVAAAAACRLRAAELLLRARSVRQAVVTDVRGRYLLLSDLYRRAGAMTLARAEVERGRFNLRLPYSLGVLDFVSHLIDMDDRAVHSLDEADAWARRFQAPGNL